MSLTVASAPVSGLDTNISQASVLSQYTSRHIAAILRCSLVSRAGDRSLTRYCGVANIACALDANE
ncbi:unnamed protein product [Ectocarpus sp. 12 AP-2014]